MIHAVLDINVLATGIIGYQRETSLPGALMRLWRNENYQILVSEPILTELARTLASPYFCERIHPDKSNRFITLLRRQAMQIAVDSYVSGIASHPEDDLILATAVRGQAQYLVTGDRQLQDLKSYEQIRIVSPRDFIRNLTSSSEQ